VGEEYPFVGIIFSQRCNLTMIKHTSRKSFL
jgi:hypothetical protein